MFARELISGIHMILLCLATGACVSVMAQQPPNMDSGTASEPLKAGVTAFKGARYDDAVRSFQKAVQVDPTDQQAHLYLGTAYSFQVVPNLQTPENLQMATSALSEFDIVLQRDPNNVSVITQEAATYRNIQQYDKAKAMEKRAIKLDPNNAEALYTVGVMDWQQAYKNSVAALAKEGLLDDGMGNAKLSNAGCDVLEQENGPLVEDAMTSLTEAIRLKPQYDDAMQYLNLIHRRRAEIHCHDRTSAAEDIKAADQWIQKAMQAHKANVMVR